MRILSLFSGAGGLDLGLKQAGHQVVWANDFDKDAVATYRRNIGTDIVLGDICEIPTSHMPAADVVVGGFPCQGFSQANRLRFEDDERNRLYLEFLRVVRELQPLAFVAENVRGILSLGGGAAIRKIEADFAACGYAVQKQLFNMADYGVPQVRQRVIIVGTRLDSSGPKFEYPQPTHGSAGGDGVKRWITISEALRDIPEPDESVSLPNHIYSKYKVTNRNFTGHRWTDPNRPSPTILARGNGKGGVCAIAHPLNHRRMSIREQATIQTFPLSFAFEGGMNSCYRQVGNAVPVEFARRLGVSLRNFESTEVELRTCA